MTFEPLSDELLRERTARLFDACAAAAGEIEEVLFDRLTCDGCGLVINLQETGGAAPGRWTTEGDHETGWVDHCPSCSTRELADHVLLRQIEPQLRAERMGGEVRFVNTNPRAEGVIVTCIGCRREARMPGIEPSEIEGKIILCPDCMRSGRYKGEAGSSGSTPDP